jgi:hypothetical protein
MVVLAEQLRRFDRDLAIAERRAFRAAGHNADVFDHTASVIGVLRYDDGL